MCKTKNIHNYDARKVAKCQDAKLNGLGVIQKNLRYVESAPPRQIGLNLTEGRNRNIKKYFWNI